MEQQAFKVKLSLSTKLLGAVIALLSLVVAFLTVSSIVLLKKDKIAYVYDTQMTACTLVGREFASDAQAALDLLRHALLSVDPLKPLAAGTGDLLQSLVNNQRVVQGLQIGRYHPATGEFVPATKTVKVGAAEFAPSLDDLKRNAASLAERGFAFINLSRVGQKPTLGVALADRILKNGPRSDEIGLAFGLVPLQSLLEGIPSNIENVTIFNEVGDVLFDTDSVLLYGAKPGGSAGKIFELAQASKSNNGAKEISLNDTSYLTSFYKPGLGLVVSTRSELSQAMRATYAVTEKLLFFGLLAIALATILSIFFAKSLTRPLSRLHEATKEVARGNFDVSIPVAGKDEIGALSHAFGVMSRKMAEMIKSMVERVRVEQEVAVASSVQANLFPLPRYSDNQIRLRGFYQSASECGGDWWGFFRIENRMAIVIADATGHGVPSALMTASMRGCFSAIQKLLQTKPEALKLSPNEIIPVVNAAVFESGRAGINMTFFVGIIDFETETMTYANAAHCPPWLIHRDPGQPPRARLLNSAGPRLGESSEIEPVREFTVKLQPNDMILFYTDGLLEGKNAAGAMYGKKKARKILESFYGRGEDALVDTLVKDFMEHNGTKALDDDLTLVAATFTGVSPAPPSA